MLSPLPGVGGSLFPERYLADGLARDALPEVAPADIASAQRHLLRWWHRVAARCGPATGLRTLFDLVAMPLAAQLGYRARAAVFEGGRVVVRLESHDGSAVPLIVRPWASRPSSAWRDAIRSAREVQADWVLLLSPPHISLVDARGHGARRATDFQLPQALEHPSVGVLLGLLSAAALGDRHGAIVVRLLELASRFQDRVRTDLQHGVVDAVRALSGAIGRQTGSGTPTAGGPDPVNEALTLVYRVLFLLFAESRALVPRAHPVYARSYSMGTLCREALSGRGTGLWDAAAAVSRLSRLGCRSDTLVVDPFNGRLFARRAAPTLERPRRGRRPSALTAEDAAWQAALVALGSRNGARGREAISYRDLGVEQLGAVYERILDQDHSDLTQPTPVATRGHGRSQPALPYPSRRNRHSDRRKETGTFYTPQALADFVVRRTLTPLVDARTTEAILDLRVVDPAMGSGAFLVSACRFLADAYLRALVNEGRLAESEIDADARADARRLVAERCLAGVDLNPVAVQLARLSLWLTSLARGKPLNFFDHRLRTGNSLIGAWPVDLQRTSGRRPAEDLPLLEAVGLAEPLERVARVLDDLASRPDDNVAAVREKERTWNRLASRDSPLGPLRLALSLWCARWFWPTSADVAFGSPPAPAELRAAIDAILGREVAPTGVPLERWTTAARQLTEAHEFFHWPLEFADVFSDRPGGTGPGFDAVIGNPPWEMLRADGHERRSDGQPRRSVLTRFLRESGCYRWAGRGHVNLYLPFVERVLTLARAGGRVGLVLPWSLAVDDGARDVRRRLFDAGGLDTIVGLDNARGLFPIHRGLRFLVLVASPSQATKTVRARFGVRTTAELDALPAGDDADEDAFPIRLTPPAIAEAGGPSWRIPDLRHPDDLELLRSLARRFPRAGDERGWHATFSRELNATDDREAFGPTGMPVVEGKHIGPFRVSVRDVRYRITPEATRRRLSDGRYRQPRLAYRDVSGVTNRLSLIAAVLPGGVVTTHTLFCLRTRAPLAAQQFLCAVFNSYVVNALVRRLMGSHVTTSLVEDLPVPPWTGSPVQRRLARLAARLAGDRPADHLEPRLQAIVAHLYGLDRRTFSRILDMFPLVDAGSRERALGEFDGLGLRVHDPSLSQRLYVASASTARAARTKDH